MTLIRTLAGFNVNLADPQADTLSLRDIAHQLAITNRFNGATELPYSVAQHCVLVSDLLLARKMQAHVCMAGLLHDAHKAYLGNIATPVADFLLGVTPRLRVPTILDEAKARFDTVIFRKFGVALNPAEEREVKLADMTALATEWRDLMPGECPVEARPNPQPVKPMLWHRAEDLFVKTFNTYARHLNIQEA
jgi:uncharacterized protein